MGDFFKEQLIKKEDKQTAKKAVIISAAVVLSIGAFLILGGGLGTVLTFAFCFGAFYLTANFDIEYEYVYTSGVMDIDIIYNKTRRKRVFTGNVKDFEVMAHVTEKNYFAPFANAVEKDYSSGSVKDNTYAFIVKDSRQTLKVIIEPDEEILNEMSKKLPRGKFHKKM